MWKMQLLDEEHILIKYASEDVVTLRSLFIYLLSGTNCLVTFRTKSS